MTEVHDETERNIIKPKNLTDLHYVFEQNQFMSIIKILNNKFPDPNLINECSTKRAAFLRKESWGDEVLGVTVMNPRCCLSVHDDIDCHQHPSAKLGYVQSQSTLKGPSYHAFTTLGPFRPFFGSRTEEKVTYEGGKLVS